MTNEELDQIIEKSFRTGFDVQLPVDFAQKVTAHVIRREQWKTDFREYLFLTGILLSLLAVVSGFYYFIDKAVVIKAFAFISENTVPVISMVLVLNFIFFADKVLLRLLFRSLPRPLHRRGER
jgi:hypothetical protein